MSPSSNTNVTAIAMTITDDAWSRKLAKFSSDRKLSGRAMPKIATSTMIARIAGSDPRSPLRRRVIVLCHTSLSEFCCSSSEKSVNARLVSTIVTPGVGSSGMAAGSPPAAMSVRGWNRRVMRPPPR